MACGAGRRSSVARQNLAISRLAPVRHPLRSLIEGWYQAMRVGVYVDGFNLYYGGRSQFRAPSAPGWRWLDIRALAEALLGERKNWPNARINRIVYCTARVDKSDNSSAHVDQDVYLRALAAIQSVDHIEFGHYTNRVKTLPLALKGRNDRPVLARPGWPIMVNDDAGHRMQNATFMASVACREEKGSDVNVATHLLSDVLLNEVDAVLVISNDSDLQLPISMARVRVPVGVVNPSVNLTAGALRGDAQTGAGRHFWRQLSAGDFTSHQLPDPAGKYRSPSRW